MMAKYKKTETSDRLTYLSSRESRKGTSRENIHESFNETIKRLEGHKVKINLDELKVEFHSKEQGRNSNNLIWYYYFDGAIFSFDILLDKGANIYQTIRKGAYKLKEGLPEDTIIDNSCKKFYLREQTSIEHIVTGVFSRESNLGPQKDYMIYSAIWHEVAKGEKAEDNIKAEMDRIFRDRIEGNDILNNLEMPDDWKKNYATIQEILQNNSGEALLNATALKLQLLEQQIKGIISKEWNLDEAEQFRLSQRSLAESFLESSSQFISAWTGFSIAPPSGWNIHNDEKDTDSPTIRMSIEEENQPLINLRQRQQSEAKSDQTEITRSATKTIIDAQNLEAESKKHK